MNLKSTLNSFGNDRRPFFFCISYDLKSWDVLSLDNLTTEIKYSIDKFDNSTKNEISKNEIQYTTFSTYKKKFHQVISNIKDGNTYLLNLTTKTKITSSNSLFDIYENSTAKYKLYYKDKFVSFSPETFIKISNNKISTFPMKGTINANINGAVSKILNNPKELAEHTMIVDLLRNDLNIVSKNVKVENFRYIDKIKAGENELYQVSSVISGELNEDWHNKVGDILVNLLPAGSITGTPKRKTVEIIKNIEKYNRGYFSGIWGIYDGKKLDSAVLIRFIEKSNIKTSSKNQFIYKSGGGITLDSDVKDEYNEMIEKVYIP
ncbi:MAG: aminodeoxychorismate synthase component I [Arcobacter sp.]|nr:aminodeoxychorismate synthase component I [Arcobacter sp.]